MRVKIIPGCIACGACVSINSDIFELDEDIHVNQAKIAGHEDDCSTVDPMSRTVFKVF